jgi:hypothetical protein
MFRDQVERLARDARSQHHQGSVSRQCDVTAARRERAGDAGDHLRPCRREHGVIVVGRKRGVILSSAKSQRASAPWKPLD